MSAFLAADDAALGEGTHRQQYRGIKGEEQGEDGEKYSRQQHPDIPFWWLRRKWIDEVYGL
jgi:hypothetical protein